MVQEIDIWRVANMLVKQHGKDAPKWAAEMADTFGKCGDADGKTIWLRIKDACEGLLRTVRKVGEQVQ